MHFFPNPNTIPIKFGSACGFKLSHEPLKINVCDNFTQKKILNEKSKVHV